MKQNVIYKMQNFFKDEKKRFGQVPASTIVEWAEEYSIKEKRLTPTQLRKFYDAIRSIWDDPKIKQLKNTEKLDEEFQTRLIFLRPAFAGAANKNKIPGEFRDMMNLSIKKVENKEDLYRFVKFFEAVIQYTA